MPSNFPPASLLPNNMDKNSVIASNMDVDPPVSESNKLIRTTMDPTVIDESGAGADGDDRNVEMTGDNILREFTLFAQLPIELRLRVWNHAFPPRVVNITYGGRNHHFSFNSSPPLLLQIHREARDFALKTYTPFPVARSQDKQQSKIWIDFARDIVLIDDDYLRNTSKFDKETGNSFDFLEDPEYRPKYEPRLIQNLAISAENFRKIHRERHLQSLAKSICDAYPALKNLYIVYEGGVNPYSRGRIRFFSMERPCMPCCESRCCIRLALITDQYKHAIDTMAASRAVLARGINVNFVGAWRGGSRAQFGHMLDGEEDESRDENQNAADDSECGYDEADEESTFLDHEGWQNPALVPEQEFKDLEEDRQAYEKLLEDEPRHPRSHYESKQGQFLGLSISNPDDYYEWRKANGGKCYPIYHPDGSYRAF